MVQERKAKKRKHAEDDPQSTKKVAKRPKRKNPIAPDDEEYDMERQVYKTIAHMDGKLLADYHARQVKRFEPDLSLVELEDRRVPESAFLDTTSWSQIRVEEGMPDFVERFSGESREMLCSSADANGSPHTLVVCAAAIRAADLARAMRKYQSKSAKVAKLFAKHIKLKEAIESVKNTRITVGVGTPQRINDLIDAGALRLEHLRHIVLDASWSGQKKRTMMDMPETIGPLTRLLTRQEFRQMLRSSSHGDGVPILAF